MLLGAHSVAVLEGAAEVEHGKHGEDHHHTLEQQGELKLLPYPEEDAQDVGDEQHEADSGGEAFAVVAPLDVLVLGHVGQGPPEHHE